MRYILIVLLLVVMCCVNVAVISFAPQVGSKEKPEGISGYDKALINENVDRMIEIACLSNRVTLLDARVSALESEARKAREVQPYKWNESYEGIVITGKVWVTNAPVKLPVNMRPYRLEDYGGKLVPNAEVKP